MEAISYSINIDLLHILVSIILFAIKNIYKILFIVFYSYYLH